MAILGARMDAGKVVLITESGECPFELDAERAALLAAGALLMRATLATKAARHGGVLFSEQIKDTPAELG